MLHKDNWHKLILAFTIVITLIIGIIAFIHPPAVYPDAGKGFQVLLNMHNGGNFNVLPIIDHYDISKTVPMFLSWWSPGQYLVPYLFILLFSINIGQATAVTSCLCSIIGLLGFNAFFKKVGFSPAVAAISVLFIMCQEFYFIPYVFYNGGEILLFAFLGWFLYGCLRFNHTGWLLAFFIFAGFMIGFFCKSSFVWMFAAGLIFLWIKLSRHSQKIKTWIINGLWVGIPALLALGIILVAYLSKGENPSTSSPGLKLAWETFAFPIASPLLAGFSIDEMVNGMLYHTDTPLFDAQWSVIILLLLAVFSLIVFILIIKKLHLNNYKLLLSSFYGLAILFFGTSFLRQTNISYEARHMRIIGLLFIPGVIYMVGNLSAMYRLAFGLFWLLITWHSVRFLYRGTSRNHLLASHGDTGIAQQFADQQTLDYIAQLDRQNRNAVFVFISPELGLEIKHNRTATLDPIDESLQYDPEMLHYEGHAGPVYILLPITYMGNRAAIFINAFKGYHNFTVYKPGRYYLIYEAH